MATCALGLEELVAGELGELGVEGVERQRGAVTFRGGWKDVWRANWRLRTANRVLVTLDAWDAPDGDALAAGAERAVEERRSWAGVRAGELFHPERTFAIRATSSRSEVRDTRWVGLRVKDGIVDAQRRRHGRRASVERRDPDLQLRVWLYEDRATLLLDTSGEPLDRRGYRLESTEAPVREQLAAACVLASGWDRRGPVVDPMCGSGTLLAEAAAWALGLAPGRLREGWAFESLPGFDRAAWEAVRREPIPAPAGEAGQEADEKDGEEAGGPGAGAGQEQAGQEQAGEGPAGGSPHGAPDRLRLYGVDSSPEAVAAARVNLEAAGLAERATLVEGDAFSFEPPPGPGLLAVNPPYGERMGDERQQWPRLGDLMKQRYAGWRAVVLAGGKTRGKHVGLRPERRIPVRTGSLDARILPFDLY